MRKLAGLMSVVLLILAFSVFTGCGGPGGNNQQLQKYNVIFNTNGGSAVPFVRVSSGDKVQAPAAPVREDYTFEGWYGNSGLTARVTFPITVTQNTTIYAKWTWIECYEIRTPSQLYNIRNNLAGDYRLFADISLSSYANWEPIGTDSAPFRGKINGNGHKITGLKIDRIAEVFVGLFGYVNGGEISNLTLENVDIYGGVVGAIAGYVENGRITNCHSTGNIEAVLIAGGIAGYLIYSDITDCHSTGDIVSDLYDLENLGMMAAGGIAGRADSSTITKSYSTGEILSYSNSGGIAGLAWDSSITGCYSTGSINAVFYSGGIAGATLGSDITDCYSTGEIALGLFSGGIAGYIEEGTITNSYSRGNINAEFSSGGIAGHVLGGTIITNCAAINRKINSTISSTSDAGRIVGSISSYLSISNNFALNTMQATGVPFDTDPRNHGVSKTDAELKTQSTYSGAIEGDGLGGLGWKFGNSDAAPWKMPAGGGYPILYWQ